MKQSAGCFVAGFGTTQWQGTTSEILQSINVNVYSDTVCKSAYYQYDRKVEFCAGKYTIKPLKGSCHGVIERILMEFMLVVLYLNIEILVHI